MKLIIAGSRTFSNREFMDDRLSHLVSRLPITEVVSGRARGADEMGEKWALANNIPVKLFPADWSKYGRSAGPRRNEQMANYADAVAAFWDGKSRGTKHMIDTMQRLGKQVYIFTNA